MATTGGAQAIEAQGRKAETEAFEERLRDAASEATARIKRPNLVRMIRKMYRESRRSSAPPHQVLKGEESKHH